MEFNHFDETGNAIMVDVSDKEETLRVAVAQGTIFMSPEAFCAIKAGTVKKGDVLGVARIAGIMATKRTSELIPLCHPLMLSNSTIDFLMDEKEFCVVATCTAKIVAKTGVEMEALMGVTTALLTIYDMCKAFDKSMEITHVHLVHKIGGKSGEHHYKRT